jgi:hypothetical protein
MQYHPFSEAFLAFIMEDSALDKNNFSSLFGRRAQGDSNYRPFAPGEKAQSGQNSAAREGSLRACPHDP